MYVEGIKPLGLRLIDALSRRTNHLHDLLLRYCRIIGAIVGVSITLAETRGKIINANFAHFAEPDLRALILIFFPNLVDVIVIG